MSKNQLYKQIMEEISEQVKIAINDCYYSDNSLNEDIVIDAHMRKDPLVNDKLVITLKDKLKAGTVKFSFRKQNDRLRRARGTVNIDVIRECIPDFEWDKHHEEKILSNPYVVRYFDLDKRSWRSCDVDRLLIIMED